MRQLRHFLWLSPSCLTTLNRHLTLRSCLALTGSGGSHRSQCLHHLWPANYHIHWEPLLTASTTKDGRNLQGELPPRHYCLSVGGGIYIGQMWTTTQLDFSHEAYSEKDLKTWHCSESLGFFSRMVPFFNRGIVFWFPDPFQEASGGKGRPTLQNVTWQLYVEKLKLFPGMSHVLVTHTVL